MDNAVVAILVAASTTLGVILTKGVDAILRLWNSKATINKTIRQDTLNEYKDLLERQQKQLDAMVVRLDNIQLENSETERNYARAEERIAHLEDALTKANIPFRPWKTLAMGSGVLPKIPKGTVPNPTGDM